ncbi:MAG: PEPxxWA-CTERM sorting domain-containing protein [Sphingomonadales bacterium]
MNRFLQVAAVALCAAAAVSPAQALVIGTADSSNSYPFGAFSAAYFQQVYNKTSFAAPVSISKLTFYNTLSPSTTKPLTDTFTLYLQTTSAAVTGFGQTNIDYANLGIQVFTGKLQTNVNGRLDLVLDTAFNYNPALGNLLLTVKDFDFGSGGNLFLDTDNNIGTMNVRTSAFQYPHNWGLVTGFNEAGAVPEPATWAMMIGGFGMIGGAMRARRRQPVRVTYA